MNVFIKTHRHMSNSDLSPHAAADTVHLWTQERPKNVSKKVRALAHSAGKYCPQGMFLQVLMNPGHIRRQIQTVLATFQHSRLLTHPQKVAATVHLSSRDVSGGIGLLVTREVHLHP